MAAADSTPVKTEAHREEECETHDSKSSKMMITHWLVWAAQVSVSGNSTMQLGK